MIYTLFSKDIYFDINLFKDILSNYSNVRPSICLVGGHDTNRLRITFPFRFYVCPYIFVILL